MEFMPEFSISFWSGWWFSLIYLIVNHGIPLLKKGALKRLFTPATPQRNFWAAVNYYISWVAWIGSVIYPVFMAVKIGTVYFYAGIFMFLMGMAFNIIALLNYITTPFDQPIVKGLYKFSRNPIYAAYNITWYGVGLALGSWLLIIIHTIEVITCHIITRQEEQFCLKKYGNDYQDYLRKVPRYF